MPRPVHPFAVLAAVMLVVLPLVIGGGLGVRAAVAGSFDAQDRARAVRAALDNVLTAQLDEETGVRGFATTHDRAFLEPYVEARPAFAGRLQTLRRALSRVGLDADAGRVETLAQLNAAWLADVADPILRDPTGRRAVARQRIGKTIIDRYRAVVRQIDGDVVRRRQAINAAALESVDRITLFIVLATLLVIAIGVASALRQRRLVERISEEQRLADAARSAYDAEKRISESLQGALMLKALPDLPNVQLSAVYIPATDDARVGGDWYDGVEIDENRVMFAIGDVAGHGLDAAVAMSRTRQAMLGAALSGRDPGAVLERVNGELVRDTGRMVTAVCGYADSAAFTFTYATAGHPPPILAEPGREPRLLQFGGVPLAVMKQAAYRSHTIQTIPGAMLVLYTDGAVEHSRNVLKGEELLLSAVRDAFEQRVDDPATHIRQTIFGSRKVADDVAIVTLTFVDGAPAAGRLRLAERVEVAASGPDAGPGAITSLSPRQGRILLAAPERRAS